MRPEHQEASAEPQPAPRQEHGIALVFSLLGMIILSLLAASLLYISNAETFAAFNYKSQVQAQYSSSAGVQKAVDWFYRTYAPFLDSSTGGWVADNSINISGATPTYNGNPVVLGDGANFPTGFGMNTSFAAIQGATTVQMGNAAATYRIDSAKLVYHAACKDFSGNKVIVERWTISVTGTIPSSLFSNKVVRETATLERFPIPLFKDAIRGKCLLDLHGNVSTDSYYSGKGQYGGSNVYTGADAQANIGSNAFLQDSGNAGTINGNAYYGDGAGTCSGGESITHPNIVQGQVLNVPGPAFPPISPTFTTVSPAVNVCNGSPTVLTPNTVSTPYSQCNPNGSNDVWLCLPNSSTPSTYFINSISLGGSQHIFFYQDNGKSPACSGTPAPKQCDNNTPCAPVQMFVNQGLVLGGGGAVNANGTNNNPSYIGPPTQLALYYSGTTQVDLTGGAVFSGTVYAPYAGIKLSGTVNYYGAVTGMSVSDGGNAVVHYDLSLQNATCFASPFRIVNETRNVF